jgi:hypothetical protein
LCTKAHTPEDDYPRTEPPAASLPSMMLFAPRSAASAKRQAGRAAAA